MLDDPWESLIVNWVDDPAQFTRQWFTSAEFLIGACGRDAGHIQRSDQNRIAPILKALGWQSTRMRIKEDGDKDARQVRVYVRPVRKVKVA